jgi:hypothetical protein
MSAGLPPFEIERYLIDRDEYGKTFFLLLSLIPYTRI